MDEINESLFIRSKRFKYLRYYEPKKSFIQYMNTPEGGPLMTELRKAQKKGTLKPEGKQLVAPTKPTESLFDLSKDPMEFNDLANDPSMKEDLIRLRAVHDQWMREVMDVRLPHPTLHVLFAWAKEIERGDSVLFHDPRGGLVIFHGISHVARLGTGGNGCCVPPDQPFR